MKFRLCGAGPAVLFVHGLPTNGRLWDYVVPIVQERFTCVVVDLPGAGESPPLADNSHDPDRYAQELDAVRQQLLIPSWHVVGHDAGSNIAVHYAARFGQRVNRLVLCSAPLFPDFQVPWFFRVLRRPLIGDLLAPLWTLFLWRIGIKFKIHRHNQTTAEIVEAFRQPYRGLDGTRHFVHLLRWGEPSQVMARTASLLPSITAPTLILHGRHERIIPTSFPFRAAKMMPNAQACLIDCGHLLPLDCPDTLCEVLLPFLES